MTKIYEALDSASKSNTQSLPGKPLPKGMMDKLVSLYQRLETLMEIAEILDIDVKELIISNKEK